MSKHGFCVERNSRVKGECPGGQMTRFVEPCLLFLLSRKNSYGYELMEKLKQVRFQKRPPDPAMVYRTLRYLAKERFVKSKWDTKGAGPAKRNYEITRKGINLLDSWARDIEQKKKALENFLLLYKKYFKGNRKKS